MFVLAFALGSAPSAQAGCTRQDALAMALVQVLGLNAATSPDVEVLTAIGVKPEGSAPNGGWLPEECLTLEVVFQVDASLQRAADQGRIPADLAARALRASCVAIGFPEYAAALERAGAGDREAGRKLVIPGERTYKYQELSPYNPNP